jgi:hypothetical protein
LNWIGKTHIEENNKASGKPNGSNIKPTKPASAGNTGSQNRRGKV